MNPRIDSSWVAATLGASYETLEDTVPAAWLPRIKDVTMFDHAFEGTLSEYGCGTYGCVFPTLDPKVVLKVTTDDTEASFAQTYANGLERPIVVTYRMVMKLHTQHERRPVHILWRDSAQYVGAIGDHLGDLAVEMISDQHEAAQAAYRVIYRTPNDHDKIREMVDAWLVTCDAIAYQNDIPELRHIGAGFIENYQHQHIFFGDIHQGNLGLVECEHGPEWLITDPGHIAILDF